MYDEYGERGLKDGGGGGDDIFDVLFGGGRRRTQRSGPRKGENVTRPMKVTLEDLYNGKTSKLAITRSRYIYHEKKKKKKKKRGWFFYLKH